MMLTAAMQKTLSDCARTLSAVRQQVGKDVAVTFRVSADHKAAAAI